MKVNDEYLLDPTTTSWYTQVHLYPNDADFPTYMLRDSTLSNLPYDDLRALLTGIYASPAGNLCTQVNGVVSGKDQLRDTSFSPPYTSLMVMCCHLLGTLWLLSRDTCGSDCHHYPRPHDRLYGILQLLGS